MPKLVAAAHAFPPHTVPQTAVRSVVEDLFAADIAELERLLAVFDHARIATRQFMMPLSWYLTPHPPQERNRIYREQGLELLTRAAQTCLERAGCDPCTIDQIVFVSSTGHATPTLDAHLVNRLGLRPTASRVPLWGLGCAAGAVALARAADYCRAYPQARVLVTALECCSLTFLADDCSKKNLVATALFADGAAAALIAGAEAPETGPRLVASRSQLFPDSYRIMGWDFVGPDMQLVLSPKLPLLVRRELGPLVDGFLADQALTRAALAHYLLHPGGARVLDACREALAVEHDALRLSEAALRAHGNVSSVSILLVLEAWLTAAARPALGPGLIAAFGPGFSAELILLEV